MLNKLSVYMLKLDSVNFKLDRKQTETEHKCCTPYSEKLKLDTVLLPKLKLDSVNKL